MGLFGSDDSDDDEKSFREEVDDIVEERKEQQKKEQQDSNESDGKSFRERVGDIQEQRKQQQDQHQVDQQRDGQLRITPNTPNEVTVSDDIQQWEYFTYDLIENIDKADAGVMEKLVSQSAGPPLPSDEVMNQLGKSGWELVETVERPAKEVGEFTSHEGTMTTEIIFRRPVTYREGDTDAE